MNILSVIESKTKPNLNPNPKPDPKPNPNRMFEMHEAFIMPIRDVAIFIHP